MKLILIRFIFRKIKLSLDQFFYELNLVKKTHFFYFILNVNFVIDSKHYLHFQKKKITPRHFLEFELALKPDEKISEINIFTIKTSLL